MVPTKSILTEVELNVIPRITSIQLEVNRRLVSFLEMKPLSSNLEMIVLLEQSERDILENQIVGLFGYLQQEKNREVFFTTLCLNPQKEQKRQYMKDSIFMLKQVLKEIRKLKHQSFHLNT